eukprot:366009-Chlamydomonas_euryale.AAC.32
MFAEYCDTLCSLGWNDGSARQFLPGPEICIDRCDLPTVDLFLCGASTMQTSGLYTASCLVTKAMMKEKPEDEEPKAVVRPYTPTTTSDTRG